MLYFFSLLLAFLSVESGQHEKSSFNLSGYVKSINGYNLKSATISIIDYEDYNGGFLSPRLSSSQKKADSSGYYQIRLEGDKPFIVMFSSPNYEPITTLVYPSAKNETLNTYLKKASFNSYPDSIRITGSFNEFDFNSDYYIHHKGNGKYEGHIDETDKETVVKLYNSYLGLFVSPPSGSYIFDHTYPPGDGYASKVQVNEGRITIDFDESFFSYNPTSIPYFESPNSSLEVATNLVYSGYYLNWLYRKELIDKTVLEKEISKVELILKSRAEDKLKQIAQAVYIGYTSNFELDQEILKEFFDKADVNNMSLILFPGLLPTASKQIGGAMSNPSVIHFYQKLVANTTNNDLKLTYLYNLAQVFSFKEDWEKFDRYRVQLKSEFPESFYATSVDNLDKRTSNIQIGNNLPDFSFEKIGNKELITNKDLERKVVLVDIWATWCGPCIAEIPHLNKVYEKYKSRGFEILSISIDRDKQRVISFFENRDMAMPWLTAFSPGEWEAEVIKKFNVNAVPRLILIDKNGIIVEEKLAELRQEKLEEKLDALLK